MTDAFYNILDTTHFKCDHQYTLLHSHLILITAKTVDTVESNHTQFLTYELILVWTFHFLIVDNKEVPFLIDLEFFLVQTNMKTAIFVFNIK